MDHATLASAAAGITVRVIRGGALRGTRRPARARPLAPPRAAATRDGDRLDAPSSASNSSRRVALGGAALGTLLATLPTRDAAVASDAGDWSSPGLAAEDPLPDVKYVKTGDGLVYEQVNQGAGEPAKAGDVAVFHWIIRRANGYFIYGSIDCGIGCGNGDPSEYRLGPDGNLIAGLDELLTGMRPGEKRRALVPPALGYVRKGMEPQPPEFGQKRQVEAHANEPLVFEVKLIKTRTKA